MAQARAILGRPAGAGGCRIIRSAIARPSAAAGGCGCWSSIWPRRQSRGGPFVVTLGDAVTRVPGDDAERLPARGALPTAGARFLEPEEGDVMPVFLFGAGHVGRANRRARAGVAAAPGVVRRSAREAEVPGVVLADEAAMVACAAAVPADAAVVILTHDHALRLSAVRRGARRRRALRRADRLRHQARALPGAARPDGVDATRLTCPIGLPDIPGKEPDVIAIATLAQLLALRAAA